MPENNLDGVIKQADELILDIDNFLESYKNGKDRKLACHDTDQIEYQNQEMVSDTDFNEHRTDRGAGPVFGYDVNDGL